MDPSPKEKPFLYDTLVVGADISGIYYMASVPPEKLSQWLCIDQNDK